jgi:hypothetical protein
LPFSVKTLGLSGEEEKVKISVQLMWNEKWKKEKKSSLTWVKFENELMCELWTRRDSIEMEIERGDKTTLEMCWRTDDTDASCSIGQNCRMMTVMLLTMMLVMLTKTMIVVMMVAIGEVCRWMQKSICDRFKREREKEGESEVYRLNASCLIGFGINTFKWRVGQAMNVSRTLALVLRRWAAPIHRLWTEARPEQAGGRVWLWWLVVSVRGACRWQVPATALRVGARGER